MVGVAAILTAVSPGSAEAVRPFVTDDARIVDYGQVETESWLEYSRHSGGYVTAFNVMAGVTVADWLEIIAGSGVGLADGRELTFANPVIQPKMLLFAATEDGRPGLALAGGVSLRAGRGELFDDATGFYLFAPVSVRLFEDFLFVHGNLGFRGGFGGGEDLVRPYWGFGVEFGPLRPAIPRVVMEVYAGDPFDAFGPDIAGQAGLRWLITDYVNCDLTFGAQPELDAARRSTGHLEYWGQVGLRLLFDVFTRGGRPGDPQGARGLFLGSVEEPAAGEAER